MSEVAVRQESGIAVNAPAIEEVNAQNVEETGQLAKEALTSAPVPEPPRALPSIPKGQNLPQISKLIGWLSLDVCKDMHSFMKSAGLANNEADPLSHYDNEKSELENYQTLYNESRSPADRAFLDVGMASLISLQIHAACPTAAGLKASGEVLNHLLAIINSTDKDEVNALRQKIVAALEKSAGTNSDVGKTALAIIQNKLRAVQNLSHAKQELAQAANGLREGQDDATHVKNVRSPMPAADSHPAGLSVVLSEGERTQQERLALAAQTCRQQKASLQEIADSSCYQNEADQKALKEHSEQLKASFKAEIEAQASPRDLDEIATRLEDERACELLTSDLKELQDAIAQRRKEVTSEGFFALAKPVFNS